MKKTNILLIFIITLSFLLSSFSSFSQATLSKDKSGLVRIKANSEEEASKLIDEYTDKILAYQEKAMDNEEEMSKEELATILSGVGAFYDGESSMLGEARKIYLNTIFPQFKEVEARSKNSKGEINYDVILSQTEKEILAKPLGLAYLMKPIKNAKSQRYAVVFEINGKTGLVVDDGKGNSATVDLREGDNPDDKGSDLELRGGEGKSSCYKYGFKSKFKGSYWTKWMWHSTGFAGYSYTFWGITIQGYSTYAKVTSWKRGWLGLFPRRFKTKLTVNLKGNIYNHKCRNPKYISKSNSKNHHWFCSTGAAGLWRSRIKTGSLQSHAYAKYIGSTDLSIK